MSPFRCQPAIIVVQPPYHCTDVEGTVDRIENVWGTRYPCPVGYVGALDDRSEELGAFLEPEALEATADGIEEYIASCFELGGTSI